MLLRPLLCLGIALLIAPIETQAQAAKPAVIVAEVRADTITTRIEALGTTRANESIRVTASVTEKVQAILFDDGQAVSADDILVELDADEERAELAATKAVLEETRAAYNRVLKLERQQFAARAQLDETRAAMDEATARIAVAEARLADRQIRAPFSGLVGLRNISVGELIESGDEITTLTDNSIIKLDFPIPSEHLSTVRPGLMIEATSRAFGDQVFTGEVKSISNRIDPVTRTVVVRAELPNPDGVMLPGLLMTVDLIKNPRVATVVPEEALIQRGRKAFVLVVDAASDNTVERREIDMGLRLPGQVEVLSGLDIGEQVITHGAMIAKPGGLVTIRAVQQPGQSIADIFAATE